MADSSHDCEDCIDPADAFALVGNENLLVTVDGDRAVVETAGDRYCRS